MGFAVAIPVLLGGPGELELRDWIKFTGRVSFFLFLVPLTAGPLDSFLGHRWTSWLVRRRGNFGLAFAGNHIAHLTLVVQLYRVSETPPVSEWVRWGGIVGVVYLGLMALLTFRTPVVLAGVKATRTVHRLGLWYLTFVFLYDLVLKEGLGAYPLLGTLWFGAVALRLAAWVFGPRRRPTGFWRTD